ncbi:hypothetical protein KEM54_000571 [Ascosphaera aggregata]|nr:hypothetical protein KEM54_000571 [Ascosphaera aggregata]
MPNVLLPATAAAYAPRSPPHIILQDPVEEWLTSTLRNSLRVKKPLNKIHQHTKFLKELLSSESANWLLCSILLPKTASPSSSEGEVVLSSPSSSASPKIDYSSEYEMIHVEAYVVHIDTVSSPQEITFKLTQDTIDALVNFHSRNGLVDMTDSSMSDRTDQGPRRESCEEEFAQEVNRFVFRTDIHALEGMGEEGDGELLNGRAEKAKQAIEALFTKPKPQLMQVHPPPCLSPASMEYHGWDDDVGIFQSLGNVEYWRNDQTTAFSTNMTVTATNAVAVPPVPPPSQQQQQQQQQQPDVMAHVSVVDNPLVFYPSSPPDSFTARSPFNSPPMSYHGGPPVAPPNFSLDGAAFFPSPSPPPSRHPHEAGQVVSPFAIAGMGSGQQTTPLSALQHQTTATTNTTGSVTAHQDTFTCSNSVLGEMYSGQQGSNTWSVGGMMSPAAALQQQRDLMRFGFNYQNHLDPKLFQSTFF